ncbi:hypothetical protein A6F55_19165 [Prescottella equi]|uniref:hypothetical protein n=1 Tax=Rhodococcus hoagii TaxID=43767 RepID=UPI000A101040|nr:hypothetical protein [Prescottella equi]ORL01814.1 hypothetical protein A6F55_19165 [Prescottella equi]
MTPNRVLAALLWARARQLGALLTVPDDPPPPTLGVYALPEQFDPDPPAYRLEHSPKGAS